MKNKKILIALYFIWSIASYITAAINLFDGYDTSNGVLWLCIGSAALCFGSAELNKLKKKDEEK